MSKAGKYFCSHGAYILVGKEYSKLKSTTQNVRGRYVRGKKKAGKRSRKEKGILIKSKLKFRWDVYGKSL